MKMLSLLLNVVFLIATFCNTQMACAESEMQIGMDLFRKKDYQHAIGHFVQALKANPKDYNALYYEAVTYHQLNDLNSAKAAYRKVINDFPTTPAAENARAALMYIDPTYAAAQKAKMASLARVYSSGSPSGKSLTFARVSESDDSASSDLANCPDQVRVPFQREGQNLVVTAFVNGRPIDMFFDTGAEGVVIRKSVLEDLGVKAPTGRHFAMSMGVGDGGAQRTWLARVNLKVGTLERKNFPMHVQEDPSGAGPGHPLLGQSFFRDFAYSLDYAPDGTRGTILFQKKGAARAFAANDGAVIPFTNMGRDMLVTVEINGRKIQMIYDTGAELCCFTMQQFQALGLSIPDDAQRGMDQGIAGLTQSVRFTVPRMQLGQVIETDVPVSVIQSSGIPYPLLGNSFIRNLRVDIDNTNRQMRVRR